MIIQNLLIKKGKGLISTPTNLSSKWKGERGKSKIFRKLGKEGNIKRKGKHKGKSRKSKLVRCLALKNF